MAGRIGTGSGTGRPRTASWQELRTSELGFLCARLVDGLKSEELYVVLARADTLLALLPGKLASRGTAGHGDGERERGRRLAAVLGQVTAVRMLRSNSVRHVTCSGCPGLILDIVAAQWAYLGSARTLARFTLAVCRAQRRNDGQEAEAVRFAAGQLFAAYWANLYTINESMPLDPPLPIAVPSPVSRPCLT